MLTLVRWTVLICIPLFSTFLPFNLPHFILWFIIFCYSCCLVKAGVTLTFSHQLNWLIFSHQLKTTFFLSWCSYQISDFNVIHFLKIIYWIFWQYLNGYYSTLLSGCYYLVSKNVSVDQLGTTVGIRILNAQNLVRVLRPKPEGQKINKKAEYSNPMTELI